MTTVAAVAKRDCGCRPTRSRAPYAVPQLWPGETAVCIAGGPSLTAEDVDYCRGKARVIVVNDAYRLAPWADALYACDSRWWNWHQRHLTEFSGMKFSIEKAAARFGATILRKTGDEGLDRKPTGLKTGRNSGYQAINLAVHFGVSRILLLGYDMQRGPDNEEHWFGHHPNHSRSPYELFRRRFATLVEPLKALGVEVINCSPRTALDCFPRAELRSAL